MRARLAFLAALLATSAGLVALADSPAPPAPAVTPQAWQALVDRTTAYLKSTQEANGGWSTAKSPGVSGVVVTGLLQCGLDPDADPARKGLGYVESLVNPTAGHIAGADPKVGLQNYVTSVNVLALVAAKRGEKYQPVVGRAAEFLKKLQWDEGENRAQSDDYYGGAGYDSKSRPDLSNTQFFLDALHDAGVPPSDPAMQKALVFVSRCQNFPSEANDRPWAGKIGDGSFIYSAAGGGSTKTSDEPNAPLTGYGSMTYAGVKSMIYCGLTPADPRFKQALGWLRANYTVEANPGMPPQLASRGLYYYYHTMAKTLDLLGGDEFADAKGVKHRWRDDLFNALAKRQRPDGGFANPTDRWMEGDANLVSGYALVALSHCKPR